MASEAPDVAKDGNPSKSGDGASVHLLEPPMQHTPAEAIALESASSKQVKVLLAELDFIRDKHDWLVSIIEEFRQAAPQIRKRVDFLHKEVDGLQGQLAQTEAENVALHAEISRVKRDASMKPPHVWEREREEAVAAAQEMAQQRLAQELSAAEERRKQEVERLEQGRDQQLTELCAELHEQEVRLQQEREAALRNADAEKKQALAEAQEQTKHQVAGLKEALLRHVDEVVTEMAFVSRVWQDGVVQRLKAVVTCEADESKFVIRKDILAGPLQLVPEKVTPESAQKASSGKRPATEVAADVSQPVKRPAFSGGVPHVETGAFDEEYEEVEEAALEVLEEGPKGKQTGQLEQVEVRCSSSGENKEILYGTLFYRRKEEGGFADPNVKCKCGECVQKEASGGDAISPSQFIKHAKNTSRKWLDSVYSVEDGRSMRVLLGNLTPSTQTT